MNSDSLLVLFGVYEKAFSMVWLYLEIYFSPVTAGLLETHTQQIPVSMMPMRERDYPAVITALQLPSSNFLCSPFPIPPVKQGGMFWLFHSILEMRQRCTLEMKVVVIKHRDTQHCLAGWKAGVTPGMQNLLQVCFGKKPTGN